MNLAQRFGMKIQDMFIAINRKLFDPPKKLKTDCFKCLAKDRFDIFIIVVSFHSKVLSKSKKLIIRGSFKSRLSVGMTSSKESISKH